MAVLLVAAFPILLLISSPVAWGGMAVGILLLYLDNCQHGLAMRRLSVSPTMFRRRVRGGSDGRSQSFPSCDSATTPF